MLVDAGLCYRNPSSQWCSPPHILPKDDGHRMTVDVREANKRVVQDFWQFAVKVKCEEIYSILTEEGVITPTRVLVGGTNIVAYVQSTVQAMLDDLLAYAETPEELLKLLRRVSTICEEKGLKLNPRTCKVFTTEW
ncbi:hypothetical protein V7S43_006752 [Phytophthora oleae]|uniref:Reverse transcriptase domain-containing protein n=1 Tax=Phytophthora oleae TaxID=2107226 RepID=A0ABD3FQB6_9STRA